MPSHQLAHDVVAVELPSFSLDDEPTSHPRVGRALQTSFNGQRSVPDRLDDEPRGPRRNVVTIREPRNSFGPDAPNRHGQDTGRRTSRPPAPGTLHSRGNDGASGEERIVVELDSHNPFGPAPDPPKENHRPNRRPGPPKPRDARTILGDDSGVSNNEERGAIQLGSQHPSRRREDIGDHAPHPPATHGDRSLLINRGERSGISGDENSDDTALGSGGPIGVPSSRPSESGPRSRGQPSRSNARDVSGVQDRRQGGRPGDLSEDEYEVIAWPADIKPGGHKPRPLPPMRVARPRDSDPRAGRPPILVGSDDGSNVGDLDHAPSDCDSPVTRKPRAEPTIPRPRPCYRDSGGISDAISEYSAPLPPSRRSYDGYPRPQPSDYDWEDYQVRHRGSRDHRHHPDMHYHQHHDKYRPSPWFPWAPMVPIERPGYGIPRVPRNPFMDYFDRPMFSNLPALPSPFDQLRGLYPELLVPPVELLADLRKDAGEAISVPPLDPPPSDAVQDFVQAFLAMGSDLSGILPRLKSKEFSMGIAAIVLRRLTNTFQVRFAERRNDSIVNRVHVVPRGRLALGIMYAATPELDVDLVLPSDFVLRRWNLNPMEDKRPATVAKALELDPASIIQGHVDLGKLKWVLDAVWEQLNGSADGFIFPGGSDEARRYLPPWFTRYDPVSDLERLVLEVTSTSPSIRINIFIKVAVSLHGQDIIVGVDQSSARTGDMYQLLQVSRIPGVSLSEPVLSQTNRTALHILNWWREAFSRGGTIDLPPPEAPRQVAPGTNIPPSFLYLALLACQRLDPTDPRHLPVANPPSGHFSASRVLDTITKILSYLNSLSSPLPRPPTPADTDLLALSSCTITDALYSQTIESDATAYGVLIEAMLPIIAALREKLGESPSISSLHTPSLDAQVPEPAPVVVRSSSPAIIRSFASPAGSPAPSIRSSPSVVASKMPSLFAPKPPDLSKDDSSTSLVAGANGSAVHANPDPSTTQPQVASAPQPKISSVTQNGASASETEGPHEDKAVLSDPQPVSTSEAARTASRPGSSTSPRPADRTRVNSGLFSTPVRKPTRTSSVLVSPTKRPVFRTSTSSK